MLYIYLAVINLVAFALCGIDKYRAKKDLWRVPEKTLFLAALLGGSIGLLLGMRTFRHKTKHKSFTLGVPLILLLQVAATIYILLIR